MDMKEIEDQINLCKKCELSKTRTNTVPGKGNFNAKVMFIGEAPGHWEDIKGEPFVGRGGQLLTKTLEEIGIKREDVFITNIAKCRPPENRRPTRQEIETCTPFLDKQLEVMSPKVLVTLGATASKYIVEKFGFTWTAMMKENGKAYKINTLQGSMTLLPVLHPAAVLRNSNLKEMFIDALKKILCLI